MNRRRTPAAIRARLKPRCCWRKTKSGGANTAISMSAVPFDEIAPIVERSEAAARQLASRARRRVRGAETAKPADLERQRAVVDAFLAASRTGNFEALLTMLDPEVVFRIDGAASPKGVSREVRGAPAVARRFSVRAQGARTALVDGAVAAIVAPRGHLFLVLNFTIRNDKIVEIEAVADPARLRQLHLLAGFHAKR
jgi:hypothetical protein